MEAFFHKIGFFSSVKKNIYGNARKVKNHPTFFSVRLSLLKGTAAAMYIITFYILLRKIVKAQLT